MSKQFFYQFSNGTYSEYWVGGLYVCDHEVTKEEWKAHYGEFQAECQRRVNLAPRVGMGYDPQSPEWKDYLKFIGENSPEDTFAAKHNMQPVECTELWRD